MPYDKRKYEVVKDTPNVFAIIIPGHGIHHFKKEFLSDHDCEVLVKLNCKYVVPVTNKWTEDKSEKVSL